MGFMNKVKGLLNQHGDRVQQGLDKAAQVADSKTKGKYTGQIRSGTQKAKEAADRLADDGKGTKDDGKDDGKGSGQGSGS
ncbi:antitoxin [Streptomyces boncukensis]|uniref:Antitoxin n=1 Tax=Streptomyces boncukensis TaxID=2711219 RepID=A0A6G4WXE7_9ACTN|nr:antitoxin [Streptomyces boncukensis]NGO69532.1 antitoxin [Streptomyces boncukensis]